jgi:hypothetical protein
LVSRRYITIQSIVKKCIDLNAIKIDLNAIKLVNSEIGPNMLYKNMYDFRSCIKDIKNRFSKKTNNSKR